MIGTRVIANVIEATDLVGTVTREYVEDGHAMVEITYDEEVFDGEYALDVMAEDVRPAC